MKSKALSQSPNSLKLIQDTFIKKLLSSDVSSDDNFEVYHVAYRARLQSAILEDFPVTSKLMEKSFQTEFENFASSLLSESYTLNEVARFWLQYLKKNFVHQNKESIVSMADLEWHMVRSFYRSEHSDDEEHIINIDEDSGSCLIIPTSTFLLPFDYDVITAYENESLPERKETWVVLWSKTDSKEMAEFLPITPEQAEIFESLEMHEEIDEIISELEHFGFTEKQLTKSIQDFFELGTRHGFLVFQS